MRKHTTPQDWLTLDHAAQQWWETYVDVDLSTVNERVEVTTIPDPDEARAELTAMLVRLSQQGGNHE